MRETREGIEYVTRVGGQEESAESDGLVGGGKCGGQVRWDLP